MVLIIARSNFQALGFKLKVKKRQNIQKLAFKYGKFLYVPYVNPIHVIPVQFEFNEYT